MFLLTIFQSLFVVISGLLVGSFLNVVIIRLPRGQSLLYPRSHCCNCKLSLFWYDLLPLISFFLLKGRCRFCRVAISWRYPFVEVLTAILFLLIFLNSPGDVLKWLRDGPVVASLIAISMIDLEHRIIPDELSLGGLLFCLITANFDSEVGLLLSFIGSIFGFSFFYVVSWLYLKFRNRLGLGGGDIKLLAMLGAFLGPESIFTIVLISSLLGSIVGLSLALIRRDQQWSVVSLPYGPFLALGSLYDYFFGSLQCLLFMIPI